MDSKQRHPVNLKQYRKVGAKWQFVPVARDAKGNPDPRLILLNGEPVSSKGGTFYLDFSENGKRKQQPIGTIPREALEAWRTKLAILTGQIEPDPETQEATDAGLTVSRITLSRWGPPKARKHTGSTAGNWSGSARIARSTSSPN